MRYQWEKCPNPDASVLHVAVRLPRVQMDGIADFQEDIDREDADFAKSLLSVEGVTSVFMDKYECLVVKARLFAWADVRPAVEEAFRRRYKPAGRMVPA